MLLPLFGRYHLARGAGQYAGQRPDLAIETLVRDGQFEIDTGLGDTRRGRIARRTRGQPEPIADSG